MMAFGDAVPRLRWRIGALLALGILVNYIDRINLSVAAPQIQAEFGLTSVQLGWLFSGFFWLYAVLQIPSGIMLDKLGVALTMRVSTLLWGGILRTDHPCGRVPRHPGSARHPGRCGGAGLSRQFQGHGILVSPQRARPLHGHVRRRLPVLERHRRAVRRILRREFRVALGLRRDGRAQLHLFRGVPGLLP